VRFINFFRDRVLPLINLLSGLQSVVVMDNANSYYIQRETIEEMFREIKIKIEYFPAYSLDLNFIEISFNLLKI
jgi:transposase